MRSRLPLDFDAGLLVALFSAAFVAAVGAVRGLAPGYLSTVSYALLILIFAMAGFVVGSVIAGRPDFGPDGRAALVRGFIATIPLYACGGLLFLPPEGWFSLIPILSLVAAGLVGPPIGIFMYRLHRRVDSPDAPDDAGVQLAWLKGELLGSWTPLVLSIGLLAALGVGLRVVPEVDPSVTSRPPVPVSERLPELYRAVESDSGNADARYELALALTSIGRFGEALSQLSVATALDSLRPDYWRALGRAAFFAGRQGTSAEAYWNALRLDPGAIGQEGLDREIFDVVFGAAVRGEERR
jgi:hypothetical protein